MSADAKSIFLAAARRAVELLRQAAAVDSSTLGTAMLADPDLAVIRGRADYVELLWELADGSPPAT